mgnify:CR=1 FL=1
MVNTNTKTNSQPTKLGVYLPQSITNATAANAWCATHNIAFNQLVIGKGTNPNHPLVVNPTKLGMQKPSTNNPVYANAKLQLITLHLPSK